MLFCSFLQLLNDELVFCNQCLINLIAFSLIMVWTCNTRNLPVFRVSEESHITGYNYKNPRLKVFYYLVS